MDRILILQRVSIMGLSSWLRDHTSKRAARGPTRHQTAPLRFRPRLEPLEDRAVPAQVGLTVTSLADSGMGSLRAAILAADAGSHSDKFTIDFAVTGTIDLQAPLPDLKNAIAVQGPGAGSLTVERAAGASFASAIATVDLGQTASLAGLTIANGDAGGIANSGTLTVLSSAVSNNHSSTDFTAGGGIYNDGTLTVVGSTVSGNTTGPNGFGGGIFNAGTLSVNNSTLSGNAAGPAAGGGIATFGVTTLSNCTLIGNSGGGIRNDYPGTLTVVGCAVTGGTHGGGISSSGTATIRDTTVSGNSTTGDVGGGVANFGTMTVAGCTVSGNSASDRTLDNGIVLPGLGGGLFNGGTLTIRDSLIAGNTATGGGGIFNGGTLAVRGCTLSGNSAADGGGGVYNAGTATVQESTLSGNTAGSNGGGIYNAPSGTLSVKDSTVVGNAAPRGRDLFNAGLVTVSDSTIGDRYDL
jgi:hypothetical protein